MPTNLLGSGFFSMKSSSLVTSGSGFLEVVGFSNWENTDVTAVTSAVCRGYISKPVLSSFSFLLQAIS